MELLDKFLTSNGFEGFTQFQKNLRINVSVSSVSSLRDRLSILGPGE